MLYDMDDMVDEDQVSLMHSMIVCGILGSILMDVGLIYMVTHILTYNADLIVIIFLFLGLGLAAFYHLVTIAAFWTLRKYELTEDGIKDKWFFGKRNTKWENVMCYCLLPAIGNEKCTWYIVAFISNASPTYPLCVSSISSMFHRSSWVEIRYTEKRMEEFKKYADIHTIPYLGKEGNGRRYEYSSWLENNNAGDIKANSETMPMRMIQGIDDISADRLHKMVYVSLTVMMMLVIAFGLAMFVKMFIENPNSMGALCVLIVMFCGFAVIPMFLHENDAYRLQEDGVFVKETFSHHLVRREEISFIAVVLSGKSIGADGAYILVSCDKKIPKRPVFVKNNKLFYGNNQLLIRSTYLRIEEFKKWADTHGILWMDYYDDEGNVIE